MIQSKDKVDQRFLNVYRVRHAHGQGMSLRYISLNENFDPNLHHGKEMNDAIKTLREESNI